MMKRFYAALCGALLLLPTDGQAQSAKTTLSSQMQSTFPDNTTGSITPAGVRTFFSSLIQSFQQFAGVNAQTGTSYTVQASDYGQLVTFANAGAITVTIPGAFNFNAFNFYAANIGVSSVNLVPASGTIDGAPNLALSGGQGVWVVSDGTNYRTFHGLGGGSVTSAAMTVPGCLAVSGSPITSSGTFAVTANGTSGGIPYFNGATTCASSAVLAANAVVLGGGAGSPPTTGTAPTTAQMFLGQASGPPLWQTQSGDVTFGATGVSTLASVITAAGPIGSATVTPVVTYDAKGRLTTVTTATIAPPFTALTGSLACAQHPALIGDVTTSAGSCTTVLANIPTGATAAGQIVHTNIAAPATPTAGKDAIWTDATDLRLHDKNASGVIGTTVVSDTGAANNFLTGVTAAGAITKAQPAFTNISGTLGSTQMPALTGDVTNTALATTISNSVVTNAKQANMAAWTVKLNNTSGAAAPQDVTIDGLTAKASPAAADEVMIWDSVALATKKATVSSISSAGSVSSVGGLTGAIGLGAGLGTSGSNIVETFGQECGRLAFVSVTTLKFSPFGCEEIRINSVVSAIPAAGIAGCTTTSAFVNGTGASSLAASTVYYVYAFSNAGTTTCDFRTDGNGHQPSSTAGNVGTEVRISAGTTSDDTRTLIGMAWTSAGSQFQDNSVCLCVASWMHPGRKVKSGNNALTAAANITTTPAEITSSLRISFLAWADEAVASHLNAICSPANVVFADCRSWIDFDNGTQEDAGGYGQASTTGQAAVPFAINADKTGLSELALHFATLWGSVSTVGTGTTPSFLGGVAPATSPRTSLWISTRQ